MSAPVGLGGVDALLGVASPGPSSTASAAVSSIGLSHFLVLSALLFALGLATAATRRNAVGVLMGIELILNAAALNFVAFSHYSEGRVTGQVFAIFIIVLAAAGATVALAIVLAAYRVFRGIDTTDIANLKH